MAHKLCGEKYNLGRSVHFCMLAESFACHDSTVLPQPHAARRNLAGFTNFDGFTADRDQFESSQATAPPERSDASS